MRNSLCGKIKHSHFTFSIKIMHIRKIIFFFIAICGFHLLIPTGTQTLHAHAGQDMADSKPEKIFRAGAATCNITPHLGGGIVGGWESPPATYVHDELQGRCLVLDDGTTKLVFIIVDIIGLNRDLTEEAKRLIHAETNIPRENVLISATHTHSATSAQGVGEKRRGWNQGQEFDEYQKFIIRRLADVVRIALNNLEPARIGWGVGSVPEHVFVRRWKMKTPVPNPFGGQDQVMMNPGFDNPNLLEPAGQPDTDVSFISVQSTDGRSIALLANYSLHYVGGVPSGHISADYFAIFADHIKGLLKADSQYPPFVGMMSNGTSGDINNNNYGGGQAERNPPYVKMRRVAEDVAREVFRVYNKIQHQDWVPLEAAREELSLKVRKPDQQMIARAKNVLSKPNTEKLVHRHEKVYAARILKLLEWPDQIDVVLQAFHIGDLGVVGIPFETIAEIGLEIKKKSPFKTTFTISFANGSYGYLPTPKQHELGGYETWMGTNNVETEASNKIIQKVLQLLEKQNRIY
jgi:neutral ceramidase